MKASLLLLAAAAGSAAQQQFIVDPRASAATAWPTENHRLDPFNRLFRSASLVVPQLPKIPLNNLSFAVPKTGVTLSITDSWILAHNVVCRDFQIGDLSIPETDGETNVDVAVILADLHLTCSANLETMLTIPPLMDHEHIWGQDVSINVTVSGQVAFHSSRESPRAVMTNASLAGCNVTLGLGLTCVNDPKNHSVYEFCDLVNNLAQPVAQEVSKMAADGAVCMELGKLAKEFLPDVQEKAKEIYDSLDGPAQPLPSIADAEKALTDYANEKGRNLYKIDTDLLPSLASLLKKSLSIFNSKSVDVPGVEDLSYSMWNVKTLDEVLRLNVSLKAVTIGGLDTLSSFDMEMLSTYTINSNIQMKTLQVNATFEVLAAPGALMHGTPSLVQDELTVSFTVKDFGAELQSVVGVDSDAVKKVGLYGLTKNAPGCLLSMIITDADHPEVPGVQFNELKANLSSLEVKVHGNVSTGLGDALYGLEKTARALVLQPLAQFLPKILQEKVRPMLNPLVAKALIGAQQKYGACPSLGFGSVLSLKQILDLVSKL